MFVITYLFKYVFKGNHRNAITLAPDDQSATPSSSLAAFEAQLPPGISKQNKHMLIEHFMKHRQQIVHNEIDMFYLTSNISSSQAIWRILGYRTYSSVPASHALSIHLPQQNSVFFIGDTVASAVNASTTHYSELERYLHHYYHYHHLLINIYNIQLFVSMSFHYFRYFLRPAEPELDDIKYTEYYDKYCIQRSPFPTSEKASNNTRVIMRDQVSNIAHYCLAEKNPSSLTISAYLLQAPNVPFYVRRKTRCSTINRVHYIAPNKTELYGLSTTILHAPTPIC